MKKKNNDILAVKTKEYEIAAQEAENAVSMVTTAMNRLKAANQKMQSNMEDIEAYCASMMAVHAQLGKSRAHNEAVISNFSKLLCVEE
jgi:prefoldin subunit 5